MSLLLLLLLVMVRVSAQAQTQVQVQLGQSLVLNCSLEADLTFWFMKIHNGHQTCISRNIDGGITDFFTVASFEKFSIEGSNLRINNITEQDLRVYSCAKKKNFEKNYGFHDVFEVKESYKLNITAPNVTNTTQTQDQKPNQDQTWRVLCYVSVGGNALLLLLLTVLVFCLKRRSPKPTAVSSESGPGPGLPQNHVEYAQYEEIQLTPGPRPSPRTSPGPRPGPGPGPGPRPGPRPGPGPGPRPGPRPGYSECIYSKAQFPRPSPVHNGLC